MTPKEVYQEHQRRYQYYRNVRNGELGAPSQQDIDGARGEWVTAYTTWQELEIKGEDLIQLLTGDASGTTVKRQKNKVK